MHLVDEGRGLTRADDLGSHSATEFRWSCHPRATRPSSRAMRGRTAATSRRSSSTAPDRTTRRKACVCRSATSFLEATARPRPTPSSRRCCAARSRRRRRRRRRLSSPSWRAIYRRRTPYIRVQPSFSAHTLGNALTPPSASARVKVHPVGRNITTALYLPLLRCSVSFIVSCASCPMPPSGET